MTFHKYDLCPYNTNEKQKTKNVGRKMSDSKSGDMPKLKLKLKKAGGNMSDDNSGGLNLTVGSIHKFADIDWRVLTIENNKALLISENVLEKNFYNVGQANITWENCTLRKYLNEEFYNNLGEIKSKIAKTRNANPNNPWYGTSGGNPTVDKVFLLSLDELVKYFGDSGDIANKKIKDYDGNPDSSSKYVHDQYNNARIAKGTYENADAFGWWLRSPGEDSIDAMCVTPDGAVNIGGDRVYYDIIWCVRPALWLNLGENVPSANEESVPTETVQDVNEEPVYRLTPGEYYKLGEFYFTGLGGTQNNAKAAESFLLAAKQGLAKAQFIISKCYGNGIG